MADELGKPASGAEVDLDNIEVDVLIICKNQNALNQSSSYLTRRGWPTTVMSDVSRAVEHIAEKRPDFVLISLSNTSNSIGKLPDLITQTFNISCIGFVEASDSAGAAKLNNAKVRYKIQGPPSGPAIQRTIRKILAERFQISDGKSGDTQAAEETDDSFTTRITGSGGTAADGGVMIQKSSPKLDGKKADADDAEQQMVDQAEVDALLSGTPSPVKQRRTLKELEQAAANGGLATGDMLFGQQLDKKRAPHVTREPTADMVAKMKESLFGAGEEMTVELQAPASAPAAVEDPLAPVAPVSSAAPAASDNDAMMAELAASLYQEAVAAGAVIPPPGAGPITPSTGVDSLSLIEKAVDGAMARICQSVPGAENLKLEEIVLAGVCPVDSGEQSGYLVILWQAPEQSAREEFLRACEKEIQSAFVTMNFPGKLIEPAFWAQLPQVQFGEWAQTHAQFSRMLAHQKREVGVAFFATRAPLFKPNPVSPEHGMSSISLDNISTEVPVNFRAFIHLEKSSRFFLYLRDGRVLQPEQKSRLQQRQQNEFFVKSEEVDKMRQYMAITFLSGLIKSLNNKKAA